MKQEVGRRRERHWGFSFPLSNPSLALPTRDPFPEPSISQALPSASGTVSVTQLQGLLLIVGFYFYFLLPSRTPDEITLPELTQLEAAGIRGASEEVMQSHFH